MTDRISQARGLAEWMRGIRRHLHAEPEVGLDLPDTHAYVADQLRDLGLIPEVHPGAGVTTVVPGTGSGALATVLRSDMDALPVDEDTGLEFASRRDGAMHACGHDLHMAMLLGAARALRDQPAAGDVVLAFQPGEETDRGAVPTLASHTNLEIDQARAFAIHVHATWPAHTTFVRRGTFMAFGDWFTAEFRGPGGHASQPHLAANPIDAAARFVIGTRALADRLASDEHLVATVTEVAMGNTVNVIPAQGRLRGTLRTLSLGQRSALLAGLDELVTTSARDSGTDGFLTVHKGYPAVVNDTTYVDDLVAQLQDLGLNTTRMDEPSMVIEDFAYFLQRWPGAMVYLGAQMPGHTSFNHAPDAVYDDDVLSTGLALHLAAADLA